MSCYTDQVVTRILTVYVDMYVLLHRYGVTRILSVYVDMCCMSCYIDQVVTRILTVYVYMCCMSCYTDQVVTRILIMYVHLLDRKPHFQLCMLCTVYYW